MAIGFEVIVELKYTFICAFGAFRSSKQTILCLCLGALWFVFTYIVYKILGSLRARFVLKTEARNIQTF